MKKFITMLVRHWAKTPVKISLTILSVALGTGILVLSLSISSVLQEQVTAKMSENGVILYVANASWASDGTIDRAIPSEWDSTIVDKVKTGTGVVTASAVVASLPFNEVSVSGTTYRLRSAVGTGPGYFDVFGLAILSGSAMTDDDVTTGTRRIWISDALAVQLFGSAEDALGKYLQPPGFMIRRGPGSAESTNLIVQYAVAGVYATPSEVARRAYGIADVVFPYTAMLSAGGGGNINFVRNIMSGVFVVKAEGAGVEQTEALLRQSIANDYGDDIQTIVWEGSPNGASTYLKELRQTISIFTVSVNILGIVLLAISSLGIFSIMVVESLGRRREIALERAIGASQGAVVKEFWTWSLALSLFGALIGLVIAAILAKPILGTISPLLGEVAGELHVYSGLQAAPILTGLLLALGCGGILGLLPAFSAVKGNIADTIREV